MNKKEREAKYRNLLLSEGHALRSARKNVLDTVKSRERQNNQDPWTLRARRSDWIPNDYLSLLEVQIKRVKELEFKARIRRLERKEARKKK